MTKEQKAAAVRGALAELVACKDLKDRSWRMRHSTQYTMDEIRTVEREYAERKYLAWENARKVLAETA